MELNLCYFKCFGMRNRKTTKKDVRKCVKTLYERPFIFYYFYKPWFAFYYHMPDTETFSNHHYAKCWLNDHRAVKVGEFITAWMSNL